MDEKSGQDINDVPDMSFGSDGSQRTILVLVGMQRRGFEVRIDLLKPILDSGKVKVDVDDVLHLPDDDPDAFNLLVIWLYRGQIPHARGTAAPSSHIAFSEFSEHKPGQTLVKSTKQNHPETSKLDNIYVFGNEATSDQLQILPPSYAHEPYSPYAPHSASSQKTLPRPDWAVFPLKNASSHVDKENSSGNSSPKTPTPDSYQTARSSRAVSPSTQDSSGEKKKSVSNETPKNTKSVLVEAAENFRAKLDALSLAIDESLESEESAEEPKPGPFAKAEALQLSLVKLIELAAKYEWETLFNAAMDSYIAGEHVMRRPVPLTEHIDRAFTKLSPKWPLRSYLADTAVELGVRNQCLVGFVDVAQRHPDFTRLLFWRLDVAERKEAGFASEPGTSVFVRASHSGTGPSAYERKRYHVHDGRTYDTGPCACRFGQGGRLSVVSPLFA